MRLVGWRAEAVGVGEGLLCFGGLASFLQSESQIRAEVGVFGRKFHCFSESVRRFGVTGHFVKCIYSDCTGTFTIHNPDFEGTTAAGAVITVKFVLSNGGRSIHTVVTSLIPPGGTLPAPALIHSEGHKLGIVFQD